MKTRERIKAMRKAGRFADRMALAQDSYPGTDFDGLFRELSEAWMSLHENEPGYEKAIRNPVMREMATDSRRLRAARSQAQRKFLQRFTCEDAGANGKFLRQVGADFAEAIVTGQSTFLRATADALDAWNEHQPFNDKLRTALLALTYRRTRTKQTVSMRSILSVLPKLGCPFPDDANGRSIMARRVRTLAKELGVSKAIRGTPGRPPAKA